MAVSVCDEKECIAKRFLSEYGLMFNYLVGAASLPCVWDLNNKKDRALCKKCLILTNELTKKMMLCLLSAKFIEKGKPTPLEKYVFETYNAERIQGVGEMFFAYWQLHEIEDFNAYNYCTHNLPEENPYNLLLLRFVIATVIVCKYVLDPADETLINYFIWLCCSNRDVFKNDVDFSDAIKTEVQNFCAEAEAEYSFFRTKNNPLSAPMNSIFSSLSKYIIEKHSGYKLGLEKELNDIFKRINNSYLGKKSF